VAALERPRGGREGNEEGVSLRIDLDPPRPGSDLFAPRTGRMTPKTERLTVAGFCPPPQKLAHLSGTECCFQTWETQSNSGAGPRLHEFSVHGIGGLAG
jgi:hypothetical protein